jgi:phospholipid transport system substrate-binding protein
MNKLSKSPFKVSLGLTLLLIWLAAMSLPVQASESPLAQIEKSVNEIIAVLKSNPVKSEPRRKELSSLLRKRFDFETMSQYVLGPQWKRASQAEKDQFTTLFSDLLEASYIGHIEAYTNEKVTFSEEQVEGDRARVGTLVLTATKEIPIEYRLRNKSDDWLVYDVIIEGVSLVRTYRDNYREIVRKEGMPGLLQRMQEKLSEIRQEAAAG